MLHYAARYTLLVVLVWTVFNSASLQAQDLRIDELMASNVETIADEIGEYPDWIELYNDGSVPIQLGGYGLSDDLGEPFKWTMPDLTLQAGARLLVFASGEERESTARPHAPFKLSADGEAVVLTGVDSTLIDSVSFGPLPSDVSYGRDADEPGTWYLFETPTPGEPNGTGGFVGTTSRPTFSQPAGLYDAALTVSIETADPDAEIRYTLDGAVPTSSSRLYSEPVTVSDATVLRARTFRTGYLPGPTATATYLLQEDTELPIVTIATDPDNLWDYQTGIYVEGPNGGGDQCSGPRTANYHQDWEIPANVSLIEPADTEPAFALDAGVKIYGGCSRTHPQKSLSVFARGRYGTDVIEYRLLPEKPIDEYQAFILRNSGNDFFYTHLRDAMMQSLVKDADIDRLAYRPAVVFINGEYWGIHNIREKINEHYVAANHDVEPDEIDMLEGADAFVIHGSDEHYRAFLQYLEEHDMTDPADFEFVEANIDVDNFIDYFTAQIYFANEDWPGNNVKIWRPQRPGGRWRWIMYDTDFGFGLYDANRVYHNNLEFATEPDGPEWPNPPQSTLALRRLLLNETFEHAFINRFADHLNETFTTERVNSFIDSLADGIRSEVPRHSARWNGVLDGWNWRVGALRQFAETRPSLVWSHLRDFFDLSAPATVTVTAEPTGGGAVRVNRLLVDSFPWDGSYFQEVPVYAEAVPRPGYRFVEWSSGSTSTRTQINVAPRGITLTAHFEAAPSSNADVVVNEIMYHPPDDLDSEDWVELINTGEGTIDLTGWYLVDDDDTHRFTLPDDARIAADGYLVLCRDAAAFAAAHPGAETCMGNWDFGLGNGGDMVRLYDASDALVDSVAFDDDVPWPAEPDGDGATLELNDPQDDNSQAASWNASIVYGGTPGVDNATSVAGERLTERPSRVALHSNHPNPFRDQTTLAYDLPKPGHVVVRIYDVLGSEVRTLVDAHRPAGRHSLRFEPEGLASGVYIYRLEAGGHVETRTMMLLK